MKLNVFAHDVSFFFAFALIQTATNLLNETSNVMSFIFRCSNIGRTNHGKKEFIIYYYLTHIKENVLHTTERK